MARKRKPAKRSIQELRMMLKPQHRDYAPLNSAWFIASILGLIISIGYIPTLSNVWPSAPQWAAAFAVVFAAMFIAGFLSMRRATPDDQLMPRPPRVK